MIAKIKKEKKKIRDITPPQNRKKFEKMTKKKKNKFVKVTGAHKCLKYSAYRVTNNEDPKIRRKTSEVEPHFSFPYEHDPQKRQRVIVGRTWSTTAVKSIEFKSFSSGFQTVRKHHEGNKSYTIINTICQ